MLRIFIRTSRKNCLILNGKYNHVVSNNSKFKIFESKRTSSVSSLQINFMQARFCSSNSSGSVLHKIFFVNAESPTTTDHEIVSDAIEYVPPPPIPPELFGTEETVNVLNKLGEPTFQSLGLGSWSPIGLIQSGIEFLHVSFDLPWWGAIAVATIIMRMCLFPLVILSQRNSAKMHNHMPAIQRLQLKLSDARNSGDNLEAARIAYDLQKYMEKSGISPLRNALVPLAQAPIFISMFIGLRRCANLPVESMKEGGALWFTDLTIADPFYGLPIITSLTLLATIEIGAEGRPLSSQNAVILKYVFRALPVFIFPFIVNFPAAILCYWASTNLCSLLQVGFLRIPKVRTYFNISPLLEHGPDSVPKDKKGFMGNIKQSWSNMKVSSEIHERHKFDKIRFEKAGSQRLVKTFKHNPVKKNVIDVRVKAKTK